ncbi:MAG: serine hydrolase domain-containing protein [Thermoanaerobaculia bacterium]
MQPTLRFVVLCLVGLTSTLSVKAGEPTSFDGPTAQAIDQLLSEHFQPEEPGAAVIAVRDGETVLRGAYGLANMELRVPMEPHMVFRIASLSKQFTAMGILILVERGEISLDDDIRKHLTNYPGHEQPITIRHLLTHTSGIPDTYANPKWQDVKRDDLPPEAVIALFKDEPLEFTPGTHFKYVNSGYFLLGQIIEAVSGKSDEQFLKEEILDPLGMEDTQTEPVYRIIPWRVSGYNFVEGAFIRCGFLNMDHIQGPGNLRSTVDDLAKWDAALYTESLLPADTLEMLWTPNTLSNGESTNYGFGMGIGELEDHRMIAHRGNINGFDAYSLRLPESQIYVAVLMNHGNPEVGSGDLANKVARIILADGP